MADYEAFAKFYDAVMGDRRKTVQLLRKLIQKNHPKARTVLELACGTGAILKHLAKNYDVSGLDLSKGMLALAKKKMPKARFYNQNMVKFKVPEKFDVILCVFDSINHILEFGDWRSVFVNAYTHLNEGGVLIFDVNTKAKLLRLSGERVWVREFDKGLMLMKVQSLGKGIFNWNTKVFERQKNNRYLLWEEDIKETSFPATKIKGALKFFSIVKVLDTKKSRPTAKDRLYFICKK